MFNAHESDLNVIIMFNAHKNGMNCPKDIDFYNDLKLNLKCSHMLDLVPINMITCTVFKLEFFK